MAGRADSIVGEHAAASPSDMADAAVFWTTSVDGRLRFPDPEAARRLGVPPCVATPAEGRQLVHPSDLPVLEAAMRKAVEHDSLFDVECRGQLMGDYRLVRVRGQFDRESGRWFGTVEDIDALRLARAALHVANERIALALDNNDTWACDYDVPAGRFWFSSSSTGLLDFGDHARSFDRAEIDALVHPDDRDAVIKAYRAHLAGETPSIDLDYRVQLQGRALMWVHDRGRVIERDEAGAAMRLIGTRTDITARKTMEAQARAAEAYLKTLLDSITDGVVAVDPQGRRGFFNRAYTNLFLDGDPTRMWSDLDHLYPVFEIFDLDGRRLEDAERPIARILKGEKVDEKEVLAIVKTSGRRYRLVYNGQPVRGPDGSVELAVLSIRDVTERRRAEEEVREVEARRAAILESLEEGVAAIPADDAEAGFVNSAFRRLFTPEDGDPSAIRIFEDAFRTCELVGPDGEILSAGQGPMDKVLRGARFEMAIRARLPDGTEKELLCRGAPLLDADGKVKLGILVIRDVTVERRAEADLATLQQELIHVSRVSAMGTMAGSLAHELNQPLAAIANYAAAASMLLADPVSPTTAREALKHVSAEALRAGQIVNRLRRFITKGEVDRQPASLAVIVREALAIAHGDTNADGTQVKLRLGVAADTVVVDRIQLQQVIFNVVRNAIEAMAGQSDGELTILSRAADSQIELVVADRGPGIAPEIAEHLFEPFVTTKPTGMGIGLPICRSIMRAHGGDIRAEARPTGGSVFILSLPRATDDIPAE